MRNTPTTPRRVRSAHESRSATVRAAAAAPSRRQQSKWQREQQQQRLLFIAVGVLAALVVAILAGGILYDNVVRANQVVATIGSDNLTASQLLDEVRPQARSLDAQARQFGATTSVTSYVDQQKRGLPDQVLNDVIDQRLLAQEAARRGISVSPAEVDDKERQTVADFQAATNPSPTPEASPTTEAEAAATPAAVPTAPAPTTPTPVPTLESSAYGPALQQLLDRNGLTEADFRKQLEHSVLRDKLQTAIADEQVAGTQEQIHVRQIETLDESTAREAQSELQSGADFADVASQVSVDGATRLKGGDMGWFARGGSTKSKQFEDAAFALQPGQTSDLVQDEDGYHIIQVLDHDTARSIPADQLATQRQKAFDDWLSARRSQDVKLSFSQPEKDWVLSRIGVRP
jgi:parvulin-like peptidyl-prolyl isomerase